MVTYTFTNGTASDATQVNKNFNDVTPEFYVDDTLGTVTSSTETDLSTITIPQNDLSDSATLHVTATCFAEGPGGGSNRTTEFRLYINGSIVQTKRLLVSTDSNSEGYLTFTHIETGVDSTAGDVEVKITGRTTGVAPFATTECDYLTVVGYKV